MFRLVKKKPKPPNYPVDIHSHLLPGLDDGVKSYEEALAILEQFKEVGTRKVYTTPHIMNDLYPNNEEDIIEKLASLEKKISSLGLDVDIQAAAEYYLDETLLDKLDKTPSKLLSFGNKYLLFETSFMNQPFYLNEFIFKAISQGYKPVLAHPERYSYVQNNISLLDDLVERGVLLQLNVISLAGYYSKPVKKLAEKLVDQGKIHFIGSDCHNSQQFSVLREAMTTRHFKKALDLPLMNYNL